ncbi:MazG nucleotide pyrophosphohydrolase domain-containing protein [Arthrobacter sp. C9C5]|uniref:MazG nucleotide pyrophosphohydrolase domain-containing protein n=1 Tax=Arthrobacter sp. C9C5 TaxID=2735267 RepID=UPI001584AC8B|nr:MazG nucleotide pyrophosphohydrolase domain-containing protein [Arthrobacter sp. C9C5]NUU32854.1 nucleotide pyrophosphohydrolase [Arthrobacter sp. C9C5]
MGALSHESLVEYLLEEAYEVAETIESDGGDAELRAELGDVLLQVVLHARLAEERGAFDFDDVARGLRDKMVRRNPHVFRADGSLQDSFPATVQEIVLKWDAVKKAEKPGRGHAFDGVPAALPALARAQKLLDRAERAGLPTALEPAPALEAAASVPAAGPPAPATEQELGELLFGIVAAARREGLDAERALRVVNRHFQNSQSGSSSGNHSGGTGSDAGPATGAGAPRPGTG